MCIRCRNICTGCMCTKCTCREQGVPRVNIYVRVLHAHVFAQGVHVCVDLSHDHVYKSELFKNSKSKRRN